MDIRWQQRLENYKKALDKLTQATILAKNRVLSDLEKQGLIKSFEFTHELAWNVMKDFLQYQGKANLIGSRDATREAFKDGLIEDGDNWMDMIKSRNLTSHTYQQATADEIAEKTINIYHPLFVAFKNKMEGLGNQS